MAAGLPLETQVATSYTAIGTGEIMAREDSGDGGDGFPGAGKTSLIQRPAAQCNGKRLALIINEVQRVRRRQRDRQGLQDPEAARGHRRTWRMAASAALSPTISCPPSPPCSTGRTRPTISLSRPPTGWPARPLIKAFSWPEVHPLTVGGVIPPWSNGPAAAAGVFADNPAAVVRRSGDGARHGSAGGRGAEDQIAIVYLVIVVPC